MSDPVTVDLDGKAYRRDGKSWYGVADALKTPRALAARLDAERARQLEAGEAARFAQALEAARAGGRGLRVLVSGARAWADLEPIRRELAPLPAGSVVIHGDANGADRLAAQVAGELGLEVLACPAEWSRYGKRAGLVRNQTMLAEHRPDLILAFHPDIEQARGTKHMVTIARKAGVPVRVVAG
jgi:hypothetical protein